MPFRRESHFQAKMCKANQARTTFWKFTCRKSASPCSAKDISESIDGYGALFDVQILFSVAGTRDRAFCPKVAKRGVMEPFFKTMAGVGHLKRIQKHACRVACLEVRALTS